MENQNQKFLTYEEFIKGVRELSHSQGVWGRLLASIEQDEDYAEQVKQAIEENKYTDMVDFCIREGF